MEPLAAEQFSNFGSPDATLQFARDESGTIQSVSFAGFRFEKE
jgi:hypothetical protein